MSVNAESMTVFIDKDLLGESPYWDPEHQFLTRVDIHGGDIIVCDPQTGVQERNHLADKPLAFAVPRRGGGFVIGVGTRVELLDPDGRRTVLTDFQSQLDENRLNDAVCDSQGRLWAGTMSAKKPRSLGTGEAALFRIDPDGGSERVLDSLTLSNGMDWIDDGNTLLHIDSDAHRVDRYEIDMSTGRISSQRYTHIEFAPSLGLPDGMTADSEGGVWIAFFGGSQVRHYSPEGIEDDRRMLPVSCPASVMLGGSDLRDLYVTTSRHRLTPDEAIAQPLAGSLFRLRVPVPGRPQFSFAG